jgi:NitT/TauT family transport system substrate-binding protein
MEGRRSCRTDDISFKPAFSWRPALPGRRRWRALAEHWRKRRRRRRPRCGSGQCPGTCLAPLYILDDLLRDEGFADVRYVPNRETLAENIARGEVDFGQDFSAPTIIPIEAGVPMVMLAGVHLSCFALFGRESIRGAVDLKGKRVGVANGRVGDGTFVMLSIIAASVGLDPAKDINWVAFGPRDSAELFAAGEIDAFMTYPPWVQELRAHNVHVILDSALDRPWSQYFCCMLIGASDFVHRNPVATKRVVRSMVRANDICAAKPD